MSPSLFARHPFKFIYTVWFLATLPLRVLYILTCNLPKSARPRGKWTYRQAVVTNLFRIGFKFATTIEYNTPKSRDPGADKDRFVLLDPSQIDNSSDLYHGVLKSNPAISPQPVAGFWYESRPPEDETPSLAVLHFHPGAYVLGGCRPSEPSEKGWGPPALSKSLSCPVLMPQYRLSNSWDRTTSFPAALQDAVTAYAYLVNVLHVQPGNIVISGDSAGGNLAFALLRYLENEGKKASLPLPRAVLLWAPWPDLSVPFDVVDAHPNIPTDYVFGDLGEWAVRCYVPAGWSASHPYISPLGNEFHTDVPIFIQTGDAEVLHDDQVALASNLKEHECEVDVCEIANAPHDIFQVGETVGFLPEAEDAIKQAARFVQRAA